jgi:hypothetical protein
LPFGNQYQSLKGTPNNQAYARAVLPTPEFNIVSVSKPPVNRKMDAVQETLQDEERRRC